MTDLLTTRLRLAEESTEKGTLRIQRVLWTLVQTQALEENNETIFDKADNRLIVIRLLESSENHQPYNFAQTLEKKDVDGK